MIMKRVQWYVSFAVSLLLVLPLLVLPAAAQDSITLEPFSSEQFGIEGLVVQGWTELGPGAYTLDGGVTVLVQQAAPGVGAGELLEALLPSLLLEEVPEPVEQIDTDALTWDVYFVNVEAPGITLLVDLALAEADGTTYLVLFQTTPDQYEDLHFDVFVPVVEAYTPVAADEAADPEDGAAEDPAEMTYTDPSGLFGTSIPTNWTATYYDDYGVLSGPDDEVLVFLMALETDDMEAALAEAWVIVAADYDISGYDLSYTDDDITDIEDAALLSGSERGINVIYEDGMGEDGLILVGGAELLDGISYVSIIATDITAIQRRQSQLAIIGDDFEIFAAEAEEELSGVEAGEITPELIATLEDFIAQTLTEFETPGVSIAIVSGDEVVYANGFGVQTFGEDARVDADTYMMIGSTTKPMTTTIMAMLVDEGLLDWDAPVREVLPEFSVMDEALSEEITIANLSCACTGVPRRDLEIIFNANELSAEDVIDSLADFEFFTEFGEAFQYSNQLVATAGYAAAAADGGEYGMLYDAYVEMLNERLLMPLGMSRTFLPLEQAETAENIATPHSRNVLNDVVTIPLSDEVFVEPIAPAGALWSTANDMARYVQLMLNEGVAPDGTRLVSAESLARTWEPQIRIGGNLEYGLGWIIEDWKGITVYNHGGNTLGFSSDMAFVPAADVGIIVLSNQRISPTPSYIRARFLELLYDVEESDLDFPTEEERAEAEENRAEFQATLVTEASEEAIENFVGTYTNDALGTITISLADDGALLLDADEFSSPIWMTTDEDALPGSYVMTEPPLTGEAFRLAVADDGTVTATIGLGLIEYVFTKEA